MYNVNTLNTGRHLPEGKDIKTFCGFPKPFWLLLISEVFERFAFYGIRWSLVLYMVTQLMQDGAAQNDATLIYGSYLALFYVAAVIGGYAADQLIQAQYAILIGALLMACGIFTMVISDQTSFKIGMAMTIVGNGLYKPTIASLIGRLLGDGNARLFSGFTIFHFVINLAGFSAPLFTQYLAAKVFNVGNELSFKVVFVSAGIAMLCSSICLWGGRKMLNSAIGFSTERVNFKTAILLLVGSIALITGVYFMLTSEADHIQFIQIGLLLVSLSLLAFESMRGGTLQRNRFWALLILIAFNTVFLSVSTYVVDLINPIASEIVSSRQLSSSPMQFALLGHSLIPLFLFSPILAVVWFYFGNRRFCPSISRAISLAAMFAGLSLVFVLLSISSNMNGSLTLVAWVLIVAYAMQGLSELFLAPIGLSAVSTLAPARYLGLAMGCWYLSSALGSRFSGIVATYLETHSGLSIGAISADLKWGIFTIFCLGILLFLVSSLLDRLMHHDGSVTE